jgi:hypothetical protein
MPRWTWSPRLVADLYDALVKLQGPFNEAVDVAGRARAALQERLGSSGSGM